jgi:hypothetical protein
MLMVVFGAGASHDSDPLRPSPTGDAWRPPLANGLFAVREEFFGALDKYPQLHPVLHYVRNLPDGVLLEQRLAELQVEQDEFPSRARELAAVRYYLQKAIWDCGDNWFGMAHGSSNYSTLLRQLKRWNEKTNQTVALVTFNYDTLLERAYSGAFDVDPVAPSDSGELPGYLTLSSFPILKPHGSVNWGRRIRQADLMFPYGASGPQNLIARAADIKTVEFFEILLEAGQVASSKPPQWLFPALAIPVDTKSKFEFPQSHLHVLVDSIPKVDRLVTIGWRASEHHFLDLWSGKVHKDLRVLVVSPGSPDITRDNLNTGGITGEFTLLHNGFTAFATSSALETWLKT